MRDRDSQTQLRVQLCDTMSIEESYDRMASDFPYILDGHLPDNFQVHEFVSITIIQPYLFIYLTVKGSWTE